jgi:hypothetical protein
MATIINSSSNILGRQLVRVGVRDAVSLDATPRCSARLIASTAPASVGGVPAVGDKLLDLECPSEAAPLAGAVARRGTLLSRSGLDHVHALVDLALQVAVAQVAGNEKGSSGRGRA